MNVRVKLFAAVRDAVGKDEISLSLKDGSTVGALIDTLTQEYPELDQWKNYIRLAVNWEYAEGKQVLHENDEVAVIPPVSGG
jgi:molybdopterin converting factor subunit 1